MFSLSSEYKVVTLPIHCDTLLLTFSPHHQVLHHHLHSLDEVSHTFKKYEQTHRICIVAETYDKGIETTKRIKQIINSEDKSQIFSEVVSLKLLSQNLEHSKENNTYKIKKIQRDIQSSNKQIAKERLMGESKKCKAKNLKIKQKRLDELQRCRQNLHKQLQDRIWLSTIQDNRQEDYLLRWLEQEEQKQLLESVLI